MSKVDAQRAMREARYAASQSAQPRAKSAPAAADALTADGVAADAPKVPAKKRAVKKAAPAAEVAPAPVESAGLCGHRSIGNKSCSRPAGHPEKAHRYK